jgi:hypothetical protein
MGDPVTILPSDIADGEPTITEFRGQTLGPVTLSIGVATFPVNGGTGVALVEAADAAL